jgi:hypothetical protein
LGIWAIDRMLPSEAFAPPPINPPPLTVMGPRLTTP